MELALAEDDQPPAAPKSDAALPYRHTGIRRRCTEVQDQLVDAHRRLRRAQVEELQTVRDAALAAVISAWKSFTDAFVEACARYVPALKSSDVDPGPAGIRAQAVARDGKLFDDFAFASAPNVLHVRNAPSPAATSSLAIARVIADRLEAA